MNSKKTGYISLIIAVIFTISLMQVSLAGDIGPNLAYQISQSNSTDKVKVVIKLRQASSVALNKSQINSISSLAERHEFGINRLKSASVQSQALLMDDLRALESRKLAANIKSHWIINVIEADLTVSEIEKFSGHPDIESILELPQLTLVSPNSPDQNSIDLATDINDTSENIQRVGADSAWALGYDGTGRVICSFDTGVEGLHPALYNSWKGHDGDSSAAWYDPIGLETFPHTFGGITSPLHGTQTMSLMVGYDDLTGEYVGVAPGAKWISAAVINLSGASIFDAFEWAADPDGNPNTIHDVPDVINHSWGFVNSAFGCHEYFWEMIDNTEALGIVNIFAAGNSGAASMSITNPANRVMYPGDSLTSFCVGNVNLDNEIVSNSSRGPSDCDEISIKPNLSAPGYHVRVATEDLGVYGYTMNINGTSYAAPHVAGAVAILRQYAPNSTVDEIKQALLAGSVPVDNGSGVPNNTYGWGLLNIPAAIEALVPAPEPDVRIYSFDHGIAEPGDTCEGEIYLVNYGDPVNNVTGTYTGSNGGIDVITNNIFFGSIGTGEIVSGFTPFQAVIDDTITSGQMLTAKFDIKALNELMCDCNLYLRVGEAPSSAFFTHITDSVEFTISNFGEYGFAGGSIYPLGFSGFKYGDSARNHMFEGSFMIGNAEDFVSDGAKNLFEEPDNDFAVAPGGALIFSSPGTKADQESFSKFNDSKAENPIGLEISQKSYSWNQFPNCGFIVMEYEIANISDSAIGDLYAGFFIDWDLKNSWQDKADVFEDEELGYMFDSPPEITPFLHCTTYADGTYDCWPDTTIEYFNYRGASVINGEGIYSHKLFASNPNSKDLTLTESEKYNALSLGEVQSETSGWYDLSQVVSTGPFYLEPGQSDTAVFAVVGGRDLNDLIINTAQARNAYGSTTDIVDFDTELLPSRFILNQNYPNPFNPSTVISFSLASRSEVELSIYNILGERVINLVESELSSGSHQVYWNGRNSGGEEAATGVYFYKLKVGDTESSRKMLLLK